MAGTLPAPHRRMPLRLDRGQVAPASLGADDRRGRPERVGQRDLDRRVAAPMHHQARIPAEQAGAPGADGQIAVDAARHAVRRDASRFFVRPEALHGSSSLYCGWRLPNRSARHEPGCRLSKRRFWPSRGHLDLDLHPGIEQPCCDHRRCRTDVAEIRPQHRPALLEISRVRQDVTNANHVSQRAARFAERVCDVAHRLFGLLAHVGRDRHGPVVETGRPRHEHPIAIHDRARLADIGLEWRTR